MGRSAPREALRAARHGLQLLGEHAPSELELDLRVIEGVALTRSHVVSEPVVAAVFERARRLADQVSDNPARARAMQGLWWVSFGRGELPPARSLAERIHALGETTGEAGLRLAGHNAVGMTLAMMGELPEARRHLEASVALYREVGHRLPPGAFVQDPGVEAMGYLGLVSWWRGEPALARRLMAEAVALAREIQHPISELIALNLAAVMHAGAGERERALALVDELFAVIERHDLPRNLGAFAWLRGGLLAVLGRVDEGLALIEAGRHGAEVTGMRIGMTGFHLQLSEACRAAGRPADAAASIRDGLALAERTGERTLLSTLYRHDAEWRHAQGDVNGANASLRLALEAAVAQGARFHELMALACARRLKLAGFELPQTTERVQEIAAGYSGDPSPVVAEALRQLMA
jgi:ATP/maltotriose-dependent transcriptional regulator MalT